MHNNSLTNYLKAKKQLCTFNQENLLDALTSLLKDEQDLLLEDILTLDFERLAQQQALLKALPNPYQNLKPFENITPSGNAQKVQIGFEAMQKGLCGCILIAGGQGTRLGHSGPKGTFSISPLYNKSLFQIFAEKVKKTSDQVGIELPLAIMTSPLNDKMTRSFFAQHNYFGLKQEQVSFFCQSLLPFLDFEGNLFLENRSQVARGPDGNGNCLQEFVRQGLCSKWQEMGIQYLNIILIDNPLANPYDFELFGHLINTNSSVTLKSCQRISSEEKVGIIMNHNNCPIVVEYHEVPQNLKFEKEPPANLSLFALTLNFAFIASQIDLPLHKVAKKSPYFDYETQMTITPKEPNCWKFERYIFDILPHSKKTTVLSYPREEIFCPLKNKEGEFSPSAVRKALGALGVH